MDESSCCNKKQAACCADDLRKVKAPDMKIFYSLTICGIALIGFCTADAQPGNNNCGNATDLTTNINGACVSGTTEGSNIQGTEVTNPS